MCRGSARRSPRHHRRERSPRALPRHPRTQRPSARGAPRTTCQPADRQAGGGVLRVRADRNEQRPLRAAGKGRVRTCGPARGRPSTWVAWPARDPERGQYTMRKLWNRRPSPAMVVACVALLVALGGTSVAAVSQLARNSVGPAQLQFGAVTNPKIRSNAVTSAKVRNRSLLRADFAPGQLPAGPTGPQGPAGPPVLPAPLVLPASSVRSRSERTRSASSTPRSTAPSTRLASSDAAKPTSARSRAGTSWGDDGVDLKLVTQELEPLFNPQNQPNGFVAVGGNDTGESSNFTVHVLCFTG